MKKTKLTEKNDNFRKLSIYIDNIIRKMESCDRQTRLFLIVMQLSLCAAENCILKRTDSKFC